MYKRILTFLMPVVFIGALLVFWQTVTTDAESCPQNLSPDLVTEYLAYFDDAREFYHVPGAAVVIVCGNEIVTAEGFGVKNLTTQEPVDSNTLFGVGSLNKSMTATMIASLVDDGYMDWDTPVSTYMPDFGHGDLTLRSMLSHTTGFESTDLALLGVGDPQALMDYLGSVEPVSEVGSQYAYQNQIFASAALIATVAEGSQGADLIDTYRYLMQSRLFDPAGMTTATFRAEDAMRNNHATPYQMIITTDMVNTGGELREIAYQDLGGEEPAGGVIVSANDLGAYLQMLLNDGVGISGERVVSTENLNEIWTGVYDFTELPPHIDANSSGLGWETLTFKGVPTMTHTGKAMGSIATLAFVPGDGIGIAVVANTNDSGDFVLGAQWHFFEALYGLEHTVDTMYREKWSGQLAMGAEMLQSMPAALNVEGVQPYLGNYGIPGFDAEPYQVVLDNDRLFLRRGYIDIPLIDGGNGTYHATTLFTLLPISFNVVDEVRHMSMAGMLELQAID